MSSMFSKPKTPKIPPVTEIEDVEVVKEEAEEAKQKEKKRLASMQGRSATMFAGITNVLKKRLGE